MSRTTTALLVPELNGKFVLQQVSLEPLQPDEALVEIHASGVCHTDLNCALGRLPCEPNAVLGHEGGGVVVETGSDVTEATAGDKVLLSFAHCGACPGCQSGHPAYCYHFNDRNFGGKRPDGTTALFLGKGEAKKPVHSTFFGQSSFARLAIVHRSSIVRVPADTPLELFAPLGCGIQTGVGAIVNTLKVKQGSSVAVFGVGSVGLAAVMAAKAVGATTIVAVDLHAERLQLAQELGATHGVIGGSDLDKIVADIRAVCPPPALGVDFAVDCAGVPIVVETMVASLGMNGRAATVGAPGLGSTAKIDISSHLTYGKEYVGCSEGDSNPPEFIPYLIDMHRQGKLPLEKIIKYYDVKDYEAAIRDAHAGRTVKAVLRWN
ncbi:alcohol dehydrogenase [Sporothrix brasiliensis 5110]|uniref:Alcohol dehydrogenase n=1 Tax=Sporothrix brasiliensis 5110 TaxID=1398154 RepID=A0A0C2IVY0_9PEZI|nr:alcohol dehydrogenase [Sporothrix brasiliensis 5110]KIH93306.1 alcohol dehydrogenase [Sporothrix brasiliensis 5110]